MNTRPKRKRKTAGEGPVEKAAAAPPSPGSVEAKAPAQALAPAPEPPTQAGDEAVTPEELEQDEAVVERVEHVAKDVGWALVAAGVIGIVMPGVLGMPFLIAGAAALWPGNRKRFQRWREGHSPRFFHGSMKQINRFLDDLERRYPRNGPR